jgi:outer membrane protein
VKAAVAFLRSSRAQAVQVCVRNQKGLSKACTASYVHRNPWRTGATDQEPLMQVKQVAVASVLVVAGALTHSAMAANDNMVSGGVAYSHPVEKGIDGINVDNQFGTSIGYRHFFAPEWAIDVDASESRHTFDVGGTGLGSARLVPLRVTGQYYFDAGAGVHPFLGAGLNYTRIESIKFDNATIDKHGTGGDLLAGAMFDLGAGVRLTAQVEQLFLKTKLESNGTPLGDAKLNPVVGSLLVGYAF